MSKITTRSYQNMDRIMKYRDYENYTYKSGHNKNGKKFDKNFNIKSRISKNEFINYRDSCVTQRENLKYKSDYKRNSGSINDNSYIDEKEISSMPKFRDSSRTGSFKYEKKNKGNSTEFSKENKIKSENLIVDKTASENYLPNENRWITKDYISELRDKEELSNHTNEEIQENNLSVPTRKSTKSPSSSDSSHQNRKRKYNSENKFDKICEENLLDFSNDYGNTLIISDTKISLPLWIYY